MGFFYISRFVKLELFFAARWIMISEVSFDSSVARGNYAAEEEEEEEEGGGAAVLVNKEEEEEEEEEVEEVKKERKQVKQKSIYYIHTK